MDIRFDSEQGLSEEKDPSHFSTRVAILDDTIINLAKRRDAIEEDLAELSARASMLAAEANAAQSAILFHIRTSYRETIKRLQGYGIRKSEDGVYYAVFYDREADREYRRTRRAIEGR